MIYAIKFTELCKIEPSFNKYKRVNIATSYLELFNDIVKWCDIKGYRLMQNPEGRAISSVDGQAVFLIER